MRLIALQQGATRPSFLPGARRAARPRQQTIAQAGTAIWRQRLKQRAEESRQLSNPSEASAAHERLTDTPEGAAWGALVRWIQRQGGYLNAVGKLPFVQVRCVLWGAIH